MLKKIAQRLMALALLMGAATGAQARDLFKNAKIDIFALAGGSTIIGAQYFDSASRLYHTRYDPDWKINFGADIPYNNLLSFETGITYGPNNLVLTNTNIFPHTVSSGSVTTYPVNVYQGNLSAVVHAPLTFRKFKPYALVGVEYDRFAPTQQAIQTALNSGWASTNVALINHNDKFGFNAGIGVDRKLTKRLSLRIDIRDHVTSTPRFGLPNSYNPGATYPVQGRVHDLVYSGGFVYHLGKK